MRTSSADDERGAPLPSVTLLGSRGGLQLAWRGEGGGGGAGCSGTPGGLVEAPAPGHVQVEREARYRLHGGKDTHPRLLRSLSLRWDTREAGGEVCGI